LHILLRNPFCHLLFVICYQLKISVHQRFPVCYLSSVIFLFCPVDGKNPTAEGPVGPVAVKRAIFTEKRVKIASLTAPTAGRVRPSRPGKAPEPADQPFPARGQKTSSPAPAKMLVKE